MYVLNLQKICTCFVHCLSRPRTSSIISASMPTLENLGHNCILDIFPKQHCFHRPTRNIPGIVRANRTKDQRTVRANQAIDPGARCPMPIVSSSRHTGHTRGSSNSPGHDPLNGLLDLQHYVFNMRKTKTREQRGEDIARSLRWCPTTIQRRTAHSGNHPSTVGSTSRKP